MNCEYCKKNFKSKSSLIAHQKNAKFCIKIQQKHRLSQSGILKRYSLNCIGQQGTLQSMRTLKSDMFELLQNKRGTKEYDMWFLKYTPKSKSAKLNGSAKGSNKMNKTKKRNNNKNKTKKAK